MTVTTTACGFAFTTTGRPCRNRVGPGARWCRAGHPCGPEGEPQDVAADGWRVLSPPKAQKRSRRRTGERGRRAAELLRQALVSDDTEDVGLRAEHVLSDEGTAMTLLGPPDAPRVARAAVVQRFGRVGALLVLGYEDQWRRLHTRRSAAGGTSKRGGSARNGSARNGSARNGACRNGSSTGCSRARRDPWSRYLESITHDFAVLDADHLAGLLRKIDLCEGCAPSDEVAAARRWLFATYAVAARDCTESSHRAYMSALDRVMRLIGPLAS